MFEKFLFCFKQKISAVLMAYTSMILGIVGIIYFTVKMYIKWEKSDSHFLTISVFHVFVSAVLISGIIWEKPLFVLIYEFVHISVLVSFLVFIILYIEHGALYWGILISLLCIICYWIFCIHIYYRQLRLKMKSDMNYINNDVYSVCSKLYENKNIS